MKEPSTGLQAPSEPVPFIRATCGSCPWVADSMVADLIVQLAFEHLRTHPGMEVEITYKMLEVEASDDVA